MFLCLANGGDYRQFVDAQAWRFLVTAVVADSGAQVDPLFMRGSTQGSRKRQLVLRDDLKHCSRRQVQHAGASV